VSEVWNAGRLDVADELVHPDYVVTGIGTGPEAVKENVKAFRAGFPDLEWTIEDCIAEANRVVLRLMLHGTHLGNFHDIRATGRRVLVQEIAIWEVDGGQLRAGWFAFDGLELRRQLGVIDDIAANSR
jgi:predicted ester cyclase